MPNHNIGCICIECVHRLIYLCTKFNVNICTFSTILVMSLLVLNPHVVSWIRIRLPQSLLTVSCCGARAMVALICCEMGLKGTNSSHSFIPTWVKHGLLLFLSYFCLQMFPWHCIYVI